MALNPFDLIDQRLQNIEGLLIDLKYNPPDKPTQNEEELLLTVKDAADYLSLSVPTIYTLISRGELPVKKRSKRCYFFKSELNDYLKAGGKKIVVKEDPEKQLENFEQKKLLTPKTNK